jgi:DNA adenine methylase
MPHTYTPLRYPGGKAKLGPFLSSLFKMNRLLDGDYAEPYAGGAGAALFLLFRGYAAHIYLNDIDVRISSFWKAILEQNDRFANLIERVPLSLDEWDRQKETCQCADGGFDLGFAFFYLNRTNRSGIMNGGVIGGRSQEGKWGIDARFNRATLAERVRTIGAMKNRISVSNEDAIDFINGFKPSIPRRSLMYLDPPYYNKGRQLYTNFYTPTDHINIAERLKLLNSPWLLTYDDCAEIRELYKEFPILESELSYSAREVRRGRELVVLGGGLKVPIPSSIHTKHEQGFKILQSQLLSS